MMWSDFTIMQIGSAIEFPDDVLGLSISSIMCDGTTDDMAMYHQHKTTGYDLVLVGGMYSAGVVRRMLYSPPGGWFVGHMRLPVPLLRVVDEQFAEWNVIGADGVYHPGESKIDWGYLSIGAIAKMSVVMTPEQLIGYCVASWRRWARGLPDSKLWLPLKESLSGAVSADDARDRCQASTETGIVLPDMFLRAVALWYEYGGE